MAMLGTGFANLDVAREEVSREIMSNINVRNEFGANMGPEFANNIQSLEAAANSSRAIFDDGHNGSTFGSLLNTNDPFLSQFKTPSLDSINAQTYPQTRKRVNGQLLTTRLAKQLERGFDAVGSYEFAILLSQRDKSSNSKGTLIESFDRGYDYRNREFMTFRNIVEDDLLPIVNIATWNYFQAVTQYKSLTKKPDEYFSLTADSIWDNFSFDGIVRNEEGFAVGGETSLTGGYRQSPNGSGIKLYGDGSKVLTNIAKGQVKIYNIFGSSVISGSTLFAIIKKFDAPTEYTLNTRIDEMDSMNKKKLTYHQKFRPFQMALLALPCNGYLPRKYLEYRDENGRIGYGKAIKLGKILFKPFMEELTYPLKPEDLYPHTDASEGIHKLGNNDFLTIILNTNDGYLSIH